MRDPFHSFREEMDRLFETFLRGMPALAGGMRTPAGLGSAVMPTVDVKESDTEIVVNADLPGIDEKDISLTLQNGVLTLRGEKKAERKQEQEDYHIMERSYGSFQRSIRLPESIDEDNVEASFEKGVLTVRLAKRPELVKSQKKIEIKSAG
jgi:HSP20 family protein